MINSITNANVYLNGGKLAGKLEELELPAVKMKMEDVSALGMFADTEIPVGLEKMEAKLKWNSIYRENWAEEKAGGNTTLIVKSDMVEHGARGIVWHRKVTVTLTGFFKEFPLGTIKASAKQDGLEHIMTVNYLKLEVDGKILHEVDVFNNIFRQDSTDVLKYFKANT